MRRPLCPQSDAAYRRRRSDAVIEHAARLIQAAQLGKTVLAIAMLASCPALEKESQVGLLRGVVRDICRYNLSGQFD
jgi:hypothetical protein